MTKLTKENAKDLARYVELSGVEMKCETFLDYIEDYKTTITLKELEQRDNNLEIAQGLDSYVDYNDYPIAPTKKELQEWLDVIFKIVVEDPLYNIYNQEYADIQEKIKTTIKKIVKNENPCDLRFWINSLRNRGEELGRAKQKYEDSATSISQHLHNEAWGKEINEWYEIIKPFLKAKFK